MTCRVPEKSQKIQIMHNYAQHMHIMHFSKTCLKISFPGISDDSEHS